MISNIVNNVFSFFAFQRKNEEYERKIDLLITGNVPDTNGTLNDM